MQKAYHAVIYRIDSGFSDVYVDDWHFCVYQLNFTLLKFEIICLFHKLQVSTFLSRLELRKEQIFVSVLIQPSMIVDFKFAMENAESCCF